jgi:Ca2+-binding RTX toxin-like protein
LDTFNEFEGAGGNDIIIGNGDTQASYRGAAAGVTVILATGGGDGSAQSSDSNDGAKVGIDTLTIGVTHVLGSNHADTITGNALDNRITGGFGNDFMTGAGGSDTFVFNMNDGDDTISDFAVAGLESDLIDITGLGPISAVELQAIIDAGASTQTLVFSNATVTLTGVDFTLLDTNTHFIFTPMI